VGAVEMVYAAVRRGILDGTYPAGARLGEVDLAHALNVSRTPVREALRRLLSDGLIETIPNQGSRVRSWDSNQLGDLFTVRAILEGSSAALAASRTTDEEIKVLAKLCRQMESAARPGVRQDLEKVADLNDEFHARIHDASGNTLLPGLIRGLAEVPLSRRAFMRYTPQRLTQSMRQHREILSALEAHDSVWAEAAMRAHLLSARPAAS
jgi:DNA-binding GntR family transcriptional regulator